MARIQWDNGLRHSPRGQCKEWHQRILCKNFIGIKVGINVIRQVAKQNRNEMNIVVFILKET